MASTQNLIRILIISIITISGIQLISFHYLSNRNIVKHIGANFETTTFKYQGNSFNNISIVSDLVINESVAKSSFDIFKNRKVQFCDKIDFCESIRENDFYYYQFQQVNNRNPFYLNIFSESEFTESYGANWESRYIWLLFDWVLVKKELKGQS